MIAKINTSGTHIQKGYLKIRIDLYPEPGEKTYAQCYVNGEEGEKQLNPCLCYFIKIDPSITAVALRNLIKMDKSTVGKLDTMLSEKNRPGWLALIQPQLGDGPVVGNADISAANAKFKNIEVKL